MIGKEKGVRVRDRNRERNWGNQVLPVATTALHHFFSSIFWYSLSLMFFRCPILPLLIHLLTALSDSLFGPHSPVIHSTCQSWVRHQSQSNSWLELGRQDPWLECPCHPLKPRSSAPVTGGSQNWTPQWGDRKFSPRGAQCSSLVSRLSLNLR